MKQTQANLTPPLPCIGRAEMSFQSLLHFSLCFTAFVAQLFLMHDFCCKNVSARPPLCLISFTAGRSLSRAAFVSLPSAFLQPLNLLRASPPICQEPLLSNSGPLLFLLPRACLSFSPNDLFFFCALSFTLLKALQGMKSVKIEVIQGVSEADTCQSDPPHPLPCIHCIGRAEMSFQSLLLFCPCFTAFVSELFLMHDFCCKNVFARPPFCLISFKAGRSLPREQGLFLKGSARLQQGTLPFVQKFLSRAM